MKTTIKLERGRSVIVSPSANQERHPGCVALCLYLDKGRTLADDQAMNVTLTPDQAGALMFALEMATDAAEIQRQRAALGARGAVHQSPGVEI